MQTSDPGKFFETDAEQATRARRAAKSSNKYGNPIVLKSKIVAAVANPHNPSSEIFVALSTGSVQRVNIDNGITKLYRGPTAPVTSVCIGAKTLFAGSWDKKVYSWDLETGVLGRKYDGHSDFVKAVVCARLNGKEMLISGGSDKKVIVWDVATGKKLHVLQDKLVNMMAIQHLVVLPSETDAEILLFSASSDPRIRLWKVKTEGWEQLDFNGKDVEAEEMVKHETSVYRVVFDVEGDELSLWTASGDGTARCWSRKTDELWPLTDSLEHVGHVRTVALSDQWVITAGRDEDVKIWERGSGRMYAVLEGHYDEVTDLVVLGGRRGERLVSVSIDGTVRTWPLDLAGLDAAVEEQRPKEREEQEEAEKVEEKEGLLTAEEEAELAELMDSDDE